MKELIVGGFLTPQFLFEGESRWLHCEIEAKKFCLLIVISLLHTVCIVAIHLRCK